MNSAIRKSVAVIVAHPDDETLWAGGTMLTNPSWKIFVVCLCRASDADRAPRFYKALKSLNAEGIMGDLDDGPDQKSLEENEVENAILKLLPPAHYDLIISHNPSGEYTRHIRHEETGRAVIILWYRGKISAGELWAFAYEDGNRKYYPRPIQNTPVSLDLNKLHWLRKYIIINEIYGFEKGSFEAETTPRQESFWQFSNAQDANTWLNQLENKSV